MPTETSRRKRGVPRKLNVAKIADNNPMMLFTEKENKCLPENLILSEASEENSTVVANGTESSNSPDYNRDDRSECSSSRSNEKSTTNGQSCDRNANNELNNADGTTQRRRQYNVEVDPAKYRKVYDPEKGDIRFACSICGNVYKWRKSLNKHWKEKHRLEKPPPLDAPVPIKRQLNTGHFELKDSETPHPAFARGNDCDKLENWAALQRSHLGTTSEVMYMRSTLSSISESGLLDSTDVRKKESKLTFDQDQPLDLSTRGQSPEEVQSVSRPPCNEQPKEVSHTGNQKHFICSVCQHKCSSLDGTNKHFKIHHIEELQREISGKSPPRNTNVAQQNEEWRLSDPKNPLKCIQCDFVGRWPTELQKHAASHSAMRPFKCLICSLTYKWRWDLAKHFDRAHPTFMNPYKKRDRDQAKSIIGQKSENGPPEKRRRLASNDAVSSTSSEQNNSLQANDRKGFFCKWCDYHGRWRSELFQHMRCHHARDKPYHCSACSYSSNWKWDVQKHVRKQHSDNEEARIIEIPDRFLFNEITLENFVEINVEDSLLKQKLMATILKSTSPLSCHKCPFVASCLSEFGRHAIVHSDETPYRCFSCKFDSKWKCDIKKHMKAAQHNGPILMNKKNLNKIKEALRKSYSSILCDLSFGEDFGERGEVKSPVTVIVDEEYIVDEDDCDSGLDNSSSSTSLGYEVTFQCMACEAQATIFDLYEHFVSSHEEMIKPCANSEERWKCPVCLVTFSTFVEAIYHARGHPDLDLAEDEYMYNGLGVWAEYEECGPVGSTTSQE